jgi:SAM-dependent methyltransferase
MKKNIENTQLNVQICKECGMVFLNPIASVDMYRQFYNDSLRVVANIEGDLRRKKRENQFLYCKNNIQNDYGKGTVLDIGAHDGSLLSFFKNDGWQVYGCDLSSSGNEFAKQAYGIELDQIDFMESDYPSDFFDAVTIFQVLEHIINPLALLKKVNSILKSNGKFIVEAPNLDYPSEQNLANYFDFEHVNYFEFSTLKNMLNNSGFEVLHSELALTNKCLRVIAQKTNHLRQPLINSYNGNRQKVLNYKFKYSQIIQTIEKRLSEHKEQKILLYGAGQHTEQLLREVEITAELNITALLDSNEMKWGKEILGFVVKPPSFLAEVENSVVVISSFSFSKAIEETIRKHNKDIPIIRLYNECIK